MSAQIRHKIQELCEEISDHQFKYYVLDAPTITDAAFDKLWNELIELEKKYPQYKLESSPTLQVGGGFSTSFAQFDQLCHPFQNLIAHVANQHCPLMAQNKCHGYQVYLQQKARAL